jgi:hypothetical protein
MERKQYCSAAFLDITQAWQSMAHWTTVQVETDFDTPIVRMECKQYCSAAFLDITQAFDKVWHTGLLYKLKLSLPLNYFLILKSYLQNRHFLIKIEN